MDAQRPPLTTPVALLKAALAKEQQAHDFYEQAIRSCKITLVRELLETLKDEESRHVRLVREMLAKLELG